jgi:hypothetical protein
MQQLLNNSSILMEHEISSLCSIDSTTDAHSELNEPSPHPPTIRFSLSSHQSIDLASGLFPSGSPFKTLYEFLYAHIPAACPIISSVLT